MLIIELRDYICLNLLGQEYTNHIVSFSQSYIDATQWFVGRQNKLLPFPTGVVLTVTVILYLLDQFNFIDSLLVISVFYDGVAYFY